MATEADLVERSRVLKHELLDFATEGPLRGADQVALRPGEGDV